MAQPTIGKLINVPGLLWGFDGSQHYPAHVDQDGNLRVATTLDLTADIEITGTQVLNRGFTPGASGANTLVTVGAADRIKLYKAIISPASDVSGEVYLSVGATKVGSVQSPKAGGQYLLVSCFPDFEYGALGDDLVLNLPSAITVSVSTSYEVVTP
jgi:hypothetical protein